MIAAFERLRVRHSQPLPDKMGAFGISAGAAGGLERLFTTRPLLEERLAALKTGEGR